MSSVPENIQLSEDLSQQIPWSTECLTPPCTPQGVEGQQPQCRGQSPERQMAGALAQPVAVPLRCAMYLVAQWYLTLSDPMDYSSPGSSLHGLLQAGVLEWVAMPSPRGCSPSRD